MRTSSGLKIAGAPDEFISLFQTNPEKVANVATAGNNKLAGIGSSKTSNLLLTNHYADFSYTTITQYDSHEQYLEGDGKTFEFPSSIRQVVANQTSFTALSSSGQVYTWGDQRYGACLGREITEEK